MITCIDKAANYFEMHNRLYRYSYRYNATKLSSVLDRYVSGGLTYDEFRYAFGTFAADTGAIMWVFDIDNNGLINGDEVEAWDYFYTITLEEWNSESASFSADDLEI